MGGPTYNKLYDMSQCKKETSISSYQLTLKIHRGGHVEVPF